MIIDSLRQKISLFQQSIGLLINQKCNDSDALDMCLENLQRLERELIELRTILYLKFNTEDMEKFELKGMGQ